ncbi:homocysteine-responsive endoplasmic reticulum-resident ubiquitin-like domain member 2 protein [Uloborus diversus]|uniref:homocysteine-responsive endoplasmic reticulum-resident ubiquitin-like domain member 2 protein n=1 Tax=Uloborus diversus TaxID=327109 RepID=UPI00240A65E3|nr:homocysteine-responsive endoplasmic reticulum-resident ubiquitin-like domain member 2 protein [Uloborus diversus]
MSVQLIIKSASQRVPDLELDCELEWTIGQVKEQICLLYPTKPLKEHLKLIYGGKLLPNHLHVKSVLNHVQEIHVMHLVCPFPLKDEIKPVETKEAKETAPTSAPVFPVPAPNLTPSQINPSFLPAQSYTSNIPSMPPGTYPATDVMQQYLAMQQMYTQFMAQYIAQFNNGYPPVMFQNTTVSQPADPVPEEPQPTRQPRPAVREEEGVDYLFILSRAVMLFALLYYYSSLQRIFLVVSIFLIISMYVKLKRESRMEARPTPQEREETIDTREESDADIRVVGTEGQEETSENSTSPQSVPSEQDWRTTLLALVSSFFSSLIPADNPPIEVN